MRQMRRKAKTPEELSNGTGKKKGYNVYLEIELYEYLERRAGKASTSVSKLINEAMRLYIDEIKDKERNGNNHT